MKIPLDDNHILVSEETCCWIVRITPKKDKPGTYERRVSGYHPTFAGAVASYIDKKINSLEATEVRQLAEAVEELKAEVRAWKPK